MGIVRSRLSRIKQSRLAWRWLFNWNRTLRFVMGDILNQSSNADLVNLRVEGIIVRRAETIFDKAGLLHLDAIIALVEDRMKEDEVQQVIRKGHSGSGRKNYYLQLFGKEFEEESPFIQIALQPRLLSLVNGYMGMWSYLQSVQVWLNFPTLGDARETQLWHRDDDDLMNVKVFIYLNDVDEQTGLFCFAPRTHPIGDLTINVRTDESGRVSDTEMAAGVSPSRWKVCTGPAGTVILADTIGYHKGLKPIRGHRVLLMLHYTSGKPRYPSSLSLRGHGGRMMGGRETYLLGRDFSDGN